MNLKELLGIAIDNLKDLTSLPVPDFRLEQAEYKKKDGIWEIVVSYLVENTNKPIRREIFPASVEFQYLRLYKRLQIDSKGNVVGMFIYNNKE
jgi:hypothetical protein